MGNYRSGPHPAPNALHELRGTRVRAQRPPTPQVPSGRPVVPADVEADPVALAHWDALVVRLEALRVLSPIHGKALALLVHALADHERVRAAWRAAGYPEFIYDGKDGRPRENPLVRRNERLAALCERLLGDFGLLPVTQAKVYAAPDPPKTRTQGYLG